MTDSRFKIVDLDDGSCVLSCAQGQYYGHEMNWSRRDGEEILRAINQAYASGVWAKMHAIREELGIRSC